MIVRQQQKQPRRRTQICKRRESEARIEKAGHIHKWALEERQQGKLEDTATTALAPAPATTQIIVNSRKWHHQHKCIQNTNVNGNHMYTMLPFPPGIIHSTCIICNSFVGTQLTRIASQAHHAFYCAQFLPALAPLHICSRVMQTLLFPPPLILSVLWVFFLFSELSVSYFICYHNKCTFARAHLVSIADNFACLHGALLSAASIVTCANVCLCVCVCYVRHISWAEWNCCYPFAMPTMLGMIAEICTSHAYNACDRTPIYA